MKKFILYILLSIIYFGAYSQVIKSNSNIFLKYINNIINDTNDLSARNVDGFKKRVRYLTQ